MARPREVEGLGWGEPFALAAARTIEVRAAELIEHSRGVLDTGDIERVHDMRVATRRLRAAMEVFEPCFPRKQFRRALKEVKALADALGERRDRDVAIVALEAFAARVRPTDRTGVNALVETLRSEQSAANEELAPLVDKDSLLRLKRRLWGLVAAADELAEEASPRRAAPAPEKKRKGVRV